MNAARTALLSKLSYDQRQTLYRAAKAEAVTVDAVVSAGLHRAPVPEGATRAAAEVEKGDPKFFEHVAFRAWPYECRFCQADAPGLRECSGCRGKGCSACVFGGCPECTARKARAAREARKAEGADEEAAIEREEAAAELARQDAATSAAHAAKVKAREARRAGA
jgi:hypothetical protein